MATTTVHLASETFPSNFVFFSQTNWNFPRRIKHFNSAFLCELAEKKMRFVGRYEREEDAEKRGR